jgi:3-oxoacyl-[acyl-carrier-protein] synthase-3
MGARIIGWGSALPEKVLKNADFTHLNTTDEWIVERTGIRERHIGGTTSGLAIDAGRAALAHAGVDGASVDLLILATTTPDRTVPATSSWVHHELGISGGAFDLNAACAGFAYAVVTANAMLSAGHERILVLGADTLSSITDFQDRSTAILFGDGAAGIVIEKDDQAPDLIVAHDLGVDGSLLPRLYADHGGNIMMDGREVFRRAVRAEMDSISKVFERSGLTADDIALFVPHQANIRIIEAVNERMGFTLEKTALVLEKTGNTSSASIPLALCDAADNGRLSDGDLVLLSGFGAGMTWASTIVRWG